MAERAGQCHPHSAPNVPAGASRTARSLPYPDRVGSSSAVSPHPAPARGQPPAPIPPGGDSGLPPRGAAQRLPALTEHRVLKCRPTNSGLAVGTRGTRGCLCNFSHTAVPMTLYFTRGLPALTGDRLPGHVAQPVGEGRSRTAAPPGRTPPTARPAPPLPCPFKTRRPAHLPQRCRFRKCHVYVVRMRALPGSSGVEKPRPFSQRWAGRRHSGGSAEPLSNPAWPGPAQRSSAPPWLSQPGPPPLIVARTAQASSPTATVRRDAGLGRGPRS